MGKIIIREIIQGHRYWSKKHQQCITLIESLQNGYRVALILDGRIIEDIVPIDDLLEECTS